MEDLLQLWSRILYGSWMWFHLTLLTLSLWFMIEGWSERTMTGKIKSSLCILHAMRSVPWKPFEKIILLTVQFLKDRTFFLLQTDFPRAAGLILYAYAHCLCRCEAFSTYPRTYDLLHLDGLFAAENHRCGNPSQFLSFWGIGRYMIICENICMFLSSPLPSS